MNQMSFVPQQPPPLPAVPVTFSGDRGAFFRLVARGAALEIVTVGFYRFWLATDMRRHLWANTVVDGDAAEYTGRAKELLIGFLFAMAILVPIYLAYFLISIEAERLKGFASIPLVVGFYAFGQFAIYRARRYRLTRTVWRGVRFWMAGSGWAYAGRSMLWALLVVLTLGLAFPWRDAALERYKMGHSYYGDLEGRFAGRGWDLFKRVWWMWLLAPFALVLFPAFPFLYAAFKVAEWRWWLSGIRFGNLHLESSLKAGNFYGLYWKVIGWWVLMTFAFSLYLGLGMFALHSLGMVDFSTPEAAQAVSSSIPFIAMIGLGYVGLILAMNVVMRLYLMRDLWAVVLASVRLHNIAAVANVAAKGELVSALGEGFADGLDVAGF